MRKVLFLIPVLMVALLLVSCGSSAPVTIDNGSPIKEISEEKIDAWSGSLKKVVLAQCRSSVKGEIAYKRCVDGGLIDARQAVLNGLINDAWIINELDSRNNSNLAGGGKESKGVAALKRVNPSVNESYLKERWKAQELLNVFAKEGPEAKGVKVTNEQAKKFYESNPRQFVLPQKRDLIVLPAASRLAGEKVASRLKKGDSVESILKADGAPASIAKRAEINGVTIDQTPAKVRAVFNTSEGDVVGPINLGKDWIVVKTVKTYPGKKIAFKKIASSIKQQLLKTLLERRATVRLEDKWRPRTLCADGYTSPLCRNRREDTKPTR